MISDDRVRNVLHWNEKVFALVPGDPPHARDELLHLVQAIATELMDVRAKLAEALAGTCQRVIADTFVACGEGGNYCSEACRLRARLVEAETTVSLAISTEQRVLAERDELRAKLVASEAENRRLSPRGHGSMDLEEEIKELEDRLRVCQEQNDALGDANELAVKLAAMTAAFVALGGKVNDVQG